MRLANVFVLTQFTLILFIIFRRPLLINVPAFMSIFKLLTANICGERTFRLAPLYNDLEPVELPTKRLKGSSRTVCSTKCYYDVTCSGFVYHYQSGCSMFSEIFGTLTFVNKTGSKAYGEYFQSLYAFKNYHTG